MEELGKKISPDAKIISGAQISADMEKSIKVMLIVTGVQSSQILGSSLEKDLGDRQLESELGIKFVDD